MCESNTRAELLDLLPVAGHVFGLSRREIEHLLWAIRRTRVADWQPGSRAVVYVSVAETATERGVSPRQINNYERAIAAAFGLPVSIAYNRRRYGRRDPATGRILTAFGFELTGLDLALPRLRQVKAEIDELNRRRRSLKEELAAADLERLILAGKTCGGDGEISDASETDFRRTEPSIDFRSTFGGCSPHVDTATRRPARRHRHGRRTHQAAHGPGGRIQAVSCACPASPASRRHPMWWTPPDRYSPRSASTLRPGATHARSSASTPPPWLS
ncbi:helix-turn-helix domain-containing protein [Oleispirillum naphthae]|uniref:helix-turn-helix domain-containing protein n=1 Tax=Oleispirillum naphthae TaxID=2838853 RepID=UPI0030824181